MLTMNGNSKTVLGVLAGIAIGAVAVLIGTNPKTQKTLQDGGSKVLEHAKNVGAKVRSKRNDVA